MSEFEKVNRGIGIFSTAARNNWRISCKTTFRFNPYTVEWDVQEVYSLFVLQNYFHLRFIASSDSKYDNNDPSYRIEKFQFLLQQVPLKF